MNPRNVPDIKKADQLLVRAELAFPSEKSAQDFKEAFEILNDYVELETPDEATRSFIANLKFSYARTVLRRLSEVQTKDIGVFVHYLILLFVNLKSEFEAVIDSYPDINTSYEECKQRFRPQLEGIIKSLQK
jgi:hypothetical protein